MTGRVVKVRLHPHGQYIWLADVDIGIDYHPQIVWGGVPVVADGSLVPVAPPGAWLPATAAHPRPYKMRRRRYRGEISEGMMCSLAELGWDPDITDRVALLHSTRPGESLDNHMTDWGSIVIPETTPATWADWYAGPHLAPAPDPEPAPA